jgi:hypothetical protein
MYDNEVTITGVKLPIEELHLTYLIHKLRNEYGFLESSRNNVPVSGYKHIHAMNILEVLIGKTLIFLNTVVGIALFGGPI